MHYQNDDSKRATPRESPDMKILGRDSMISPEDSMNATLNTNKMINKNKVENRTI